MYQPRKGLPVFRDELFTLREVEESDAPSLTQHLSDEEVARFISRPPDTVAAFERWIARARTQRADGTFVCFAIVPADRALAVGLIQLWRLDKTVDTGEWGVGFLISREYWGTGIFGGAVRIALAFAFETLQAIRVQAVCAVHNARGNRALEKLGAVCTGIAMQTHDPDGRPGDFNEWEIRPEALPRP